MGEPESEWSRFIQLLASSSDVDLATLYGLLVQKRLNLWGNLSKEAIQVLALRCLEGVYDPAKVLTIHTSCNRKQQFRPDFSETPLTVLRLAIQQSNLKNTGPYELHNLREGASDELVSNVHAFVDHKKTHFADAVKQQQQQQVTLPEEALNASTTTQNNHSPTPTTPLCLERDTLSLQQHRVQVAAPELQNATTHKQNKDLDDKSATPSPQGSKKRDRCSFQTEAHVEGRKKLSPRNKPRHDEEVAIGSTEQCTPPIDVDEQQPDPAESQKMHAKHTLHGSTQLDACIKCKEGGEVLRCIARCCEIVVHARCLGFLPKYDNKGDFLCPVCAYSCAVSECAEAEKNMRLATAEQSLFHSALNRHANPRVQARDVDKGFEVTYAEMTSKDKEPVRSGSATPCEDNSSKPQKGTCPVDRASSKDQQQEGHLAPRNADTAPNPSSKGAGDDLRHAEGKQKLQIEDFDDAGLHGGNHNQQIHGPSKNASCDTTGTEEANSCKTKPSRNCNYNVNLTPSPRRCRRTPLPWTEDEVKMLKEGMKRFAPRNNESIPWNNILDFGSSVFSKRRTGRDLKNKWRNLVLSGKTE